MSVRALRHRTVLASASAALAATSLVGCSDDVAENGSSPGSDATGDGEAALTFEDVSDDLGTRVDERVRVRAQVEDIVTPSVFTINAADGNDLESIVVVGEESARYLEPDEEVVIEATVEPSLVPSQVARLLDVQLDDEMLTDYRGDPYLSADDVTEAG